MNFLFALITFRTFFFSKEYIVFYQFLVLKKVEE